MKNFTEREIEITLDGRAMLVLVRTTKDALTFRATDFNSGELLYTEKTAPHELLGQVAWKLFHLPDGAA